MSFFVFGHRSPDTDSTGSAIIWAWYLTEIKKTPATAKVLGEPNNEAKFVLNFWGISKPDVLGELAAETPVVIVDTNNPDELPENINQCQIQEIIDHHKWVGGLATKDIINITVRPLGCTATLMIELMGVKVADQMPDRLKGLALSCILSDTLVFKSPTTTEQDRKVAENLAVDLGIDIKSYANQMLQAKSDISGLSDSSLLTLDSKDYVINDTKFRVSLLETQTPGAVLSRKAGLKKAIPDTIASSSIDQILLFVIDISREEATLIIPDEHTKALAELVFGAKVTEDTMVLPGLMSRKKQIVPALHRSLDGNCNLAA
ncbi:manganese-dependent inorganic pyrophosphatase [Rhodobacteraceae bacterium Araon29]